jgi:GTP-binding protein
LREKKKAEGPPNGGDGGVGGDVIIESDPNQENLFGLKKVIVAGNGISGSGKNQHGRKGEDAIIKAPVGTLVYEYNVAAKKMGQLIVEVTDGESSCNDRFQQ